MIGPDDDFGGGYEEYEASPYNGDDQDGYEFDTFGPEEVSDEEAAEDEESEEPSDEEIAEWEAAEQAEDAGLDAYWEDRLSGLTGFELGE